MRCGRITKQFKEKRCSDSISNRKERKGEIKIVVMWVKGQKKGKDKVVEEEETKEKQQC